MELKGETDGQWPCNGDIRYGEFRGPVCPRQWVIASLVCGSPDTAGGSKGRRPGGWSTTVQTGLLFGRLFLSSEMGTDLGFRRPGFEARLFCLVSLCTSLSELICKFGVSSLYFPGLFKEFHEIMGLSVF